MHDGPDPDRGAPSTSLTATRARRWIPGSATRFVLAALSALLAFVASEVLLRRFSPAGDPMHWMKVQATLPLRSVPSQHPPGLRLTVMPEPALPGLRGPITFTTNNAGFRGGWLAIPKPADEYRIFMVGGSTTETLTLDDRDAPTAVLERFLRARLPGRNVRVYAAAKSGDHSNHHLAMISQRLMHLQPDMVIVFLGINDVRAGAARVRYDEYEWDPLAPLGDPYMVAESKRLRFLALLRGAADEWQIARHVERVFTRWRADPSRVDRMTPPTFDELLRWFNHTGRTLPTDIALRCRIAREKPMVDRPPAEDLEGFRANVRSMIGAVQANGARAVLVTQKTTWDDPIDPRLQRWLWMNAVGAVRYPTSAMAAAMAHYNEETRRAAQQASAGLYDFARAVPGTAELFYDDVHFTIEGARVFGEGLGEVVLREIAASGR